MKMKIFNSIVILAMVLSLPVIATRSAYSPEGVSVKPRIAIGAQTPSGEHLIMPRDEIILAELTELGKVSDLSTEEDIKAAVAQYKTAFAKKSDTWVNPQMEEKALTREQQLTSSSMAAQTVQPVSVSIFTLAVDFATSGEVVYYDDVFSELLGVLTELYPSTAHCLVRLWVRFPIQPQPITTRSGMTRRSIYQIQGHSITS